MYHELRIYQNGLHNYQVIVTPVRMKSDFPYSKYHYNDNKLENNIARARSAIFDYALCNDFKFFVTLTFNDTHNRFDLHHLRLLFNNLVRTMRKKGFDDLSYIIVPEQHKNGAWHFHGLFSAGFGKDFYYNDNGYLSWSSFDFYGFSSISCIRNYVACCKYITKYISKTLSKREKGSYCYFHSQGLKRSELVKSYVVSGILPTYYDFTNRYVKKVLLNYDDLVTFIDNLNTYNKIVYIS